MVRAIGIAFVAIGNTPERIIGATFVVFWLAVGFREIWERYAGRHTKPSSSCRLAWTSAHDNETGYRADP